MVKELAILEQLVEAWLQKLASANEPVWPLVKSFLQKSDAGPTLLIDVSQADLQVQKLLQATWYYDFEASFTTCHYYKTLMFL